MFLSIEIICFNQYLMVSGLSKTKCTLWWKLFALQVAKHTKADMHMIWTELCRSNLTMSWIKSVKHTYIYIYFKCLYSFSLSCAVFRLGGKEVFIFPKGEVANRRVSKTAVSTTGLSLSGSHCHSVSYLGLTHFTVSAVCKHHAGISRWFEKRQPIFTDKL